MKEKHILRCDALLGWCKSTLVLVSQNHRMFRERSRTVSAQSWATPCGTTLRDLDDQGEPYLQVFANHPAVGNIMGWPRELLPVLQQPLRSLPVLVVFPMLDVRVLWLFDRQLKRIIPVAEGQRSMAVLVGSKQLARIHGDDAPRRITEVLLSLAEGDDNLAADARHSLDALGLKLVVEAWSGGQRMAIASAKSSGPAGVDVIGKVVQDYGWRLLASIKQSLRVVRLPRLLEHLWGRCTDGQFLTSYVYSDLVGYQTSDIRLLWTIITRP